MFRLGPAVGVRNPTAAGTAYDPYVIAGWCFAPDDPAVSEVSDIRLNGTRDHVVIRDNVVERADDAPGLHLQDTRNVTVDRNVVRTNEQTGIEVDRSPGTVLTNNTVAFNGIIGVAIQRSDGAVLANNTVRDGNFFGGIGVDDSTGVQVLGNTFRHNQEAGLILFDAPGTRLRRNTFEGRPGSVFEDGLDVRADDVDDARLDIDTSNTVNGDPLRYVVEDDVVVPAPAGQVLVADAANVTVDGLAINNTGNAVQALFSSNVDVTDNTLTGNGGAVEFVGTDTGTVRENAIRDNGWGVEVDESRGVEVRNNTIADSRSSGVGADDARDLLVAGNNITGNDIGVRLHGGSGHVVRSNNIYDNKGVLDRGEDAREGLEADHAGTVDARRNWWGCPDGPDVSDCDSVTGDVIYDPWLSSPNPNAGAS